MTKADDELRDAVLKKMLSTPPESNKKMAKRKKIDREIKKIDEKKK